MKYASWLSLAFSIAPDRFRAPASVERAIKANEMANRIELKLREISLFRKRLDLHKPGLTETTITSGNEGIK